MQVCFYLSESRFHLPSSMRLPTEFCIWFNWTLIELALTSKTGKALSKELPFRRRPVRDTVSICSLFFKNHAKHLQSSHHGRAHHSHRRHLSQQAEALEIAFALDFLDRASRYGGDANSVDVGEEGDGIEGLSHGPKISVTGTAFRSGVLGNWFTRTDLFAVRNFWAKERLKTMRRAMLIQLAQTRPSAPKSRTRRKNHALPVKRKEKRPIQRLCRRRSDVVAVAATKASDTPLMASKGM